MLSERQHIELERDGFLVLKGFLNEQQLLAPLLNRIQTVGTSLDPRFSLEDATTIERMSPAHRTALYRSLRYLPELTQLGSSEPILRLVRSLGLREPALMHSYNVRMDLPSEDQFLFHWHQDITYLLGSTNSVTLWIPLGPADAEHGSIEVIPGSHKEGVRPFVFTGDGAVDSTRRLSPKDVHLKDDPGTGALVSANRQDLVVFSQFLLHKSTPNRSTSPRWTAQLRFSDLRDPDFVAAQFPFGDATNIYHTSYLGNWSPRDE